MKISKEKNKNLIYYYYNYYYCIHITLNYLQLTSILNLFLGN